jgi:hypothetical protein
MADPRLAAQNFVSLCKTEKIKIPPNTAMHTAFLAASSHADPSLLCSNATLKERSAALKWAQNSLALQED